MDYLLKSNSWRIISEDLFIKIIDKSVLHNNGTGIPKELKSFFEIENLKNGDKIIITINYNNEEYYARFEITSLNRARMMWKSGLANLLKK